VNNAKIFNTVEVERKCRKLKARKAAGVDGITGENLKYGGPVLYNTLKIIFNSITLFRKVPPQFKRAVIIPIPKGKDKKLIDKDNYRGISLLTVIAKVYEQLLSDWFDQSTESVGDVQGAAQKHCSSLHSTLLLREVIQYNVFRGSTVYVAMIDARKAYDTVGYDQLFYKLRAMKCNNILWQILRDFYTHLILCGYVNEWCDLYIVTCNFVCDMYTLKLRKYNHMV